MQAIRLDLRNLYAIGFTALLHVALIGGLVLVLGTSIITMHLPRTTADLIAEKTVESPPLPAPQPLLIDPGDVVLPLPNLPPVVSSAGAITPPVEATRGTLPVTTPAPAALLAPVVVLPRVDPLRPFVPHFPATSRRLGESGSVVLGFVVDAEGRVVSQSIEMLAGSGYSRLDEAARKAILEVRFLPGTQDGTAMPMRHQFRITYALDG